MRFLFKKIHSLVTAVLHFLKTKWLVPVIVAGLLFWSIIGYITYKNVTTDLASIERITDSFLAHTSTADYQTAYQFMSEQTKKKISFTTFKDGVSYPKGLYVGIQKVEFFNFQYYFYSGQPVTLNYKGGITYDDNTTGTLTATFIKENDQWKIKSIWIYAEPERIKKFQK